MRGLDHQENDAAYFSRSFLKWPGVLLVTLGIVVGETMLSWIFAAAARLDHKTLPYRWPYYYVLMANGHSDRHLDLWGFWLNYQHWHTPGFFTKSGAFAYPPANALLYWLYLPGAHPALLFQATITAVVVAACIGFTLALRNAGIPLLQAAAYTAALAVFSAPLAFEYNRLNMEIIVFALIAGAIYCFRRESYVSSGALLGAATAVKLYPFMLLALLYSRKKYGALAVAILVAAALTVAGLLGETGNLAASWQGTAHSLQAFGSAFVGGFAPAWGWDHSAFGLIKVLHRVATGVAGFQQKSSRIYMDAAALGSLLLYFLRIRKMPEFNQIASLILLTILIPPASFEYTLLHLYTVFAVFACLLVRREMRGVRTPRSAAFAVCFGVPFGLLGFVFAWGSTCEGPVKCVFLLALLVLAVRVPLEDVERLQDQPMRAITA